jgi:putative transposase
MVSHLVKDRVLSIKQSCHLLNVTWYYREERRLGARDAPEVEALDAVVAKHGRWGNSSFP